VTKNKAPAPGRLEQRCIEWTGAGGDYYLAVVVERDKVIAEHWGARDEVLRWMDTQWPHVPRKFAPMVYSPVRRVRSPNGPRLVKNSTAGAAPRAI